MNRVEGPSVSGNITLPAIRHYECNIILMLVAVPRVFSSRFSASNVTSLSTQFQVLAHILSCIQGS